MSDFDFGFTMVDEDELEIVQAVKSTAETSASEVDKLQKKCDNLYNMVMPLLNNLAQNPDKDYIKWNGADRMKKIEQFRDKMDEVYTS